MTDLLLAGGHGLQLLERGPEHGPSKAQADGRSGGLSRNSTQKVVVFSNYADASVRKRCAQLGVDAVFDKSTQLNDLLDYCTRMDARLRARLQARPAFEAAPGLP